MTETAAALVAAVQAELAPHDDDNRLVPLVAAGSASLTALAALGAEEMSIVDSDRRAFHVLAARAQGPAGVGFYSMLAQGETLALAELPAFVAACGWDDARVAAYRPQAGCQAYPAYVAWLALNGDPAEVAVTMLANFAAWGTYCGRIAGGLREHYGFDTGATAFFDFFATPAPDLEALALGTVQAALDGGAALDRARQYARLLQHYELSFWNTLAADGSGGA